MSWTATDQSRFGPVSMSKSCSSSLMIPSDDCAASVENFSIGFSAVLARQAAAAASAGNVYLNNMVDDEQEVLRDGGGYVSCHRSTTRRVSSSSRRELRFTTSFYVACAPPSSLSFAILLLYQCRFAISHSVQQQHRHYLLPYAEIERV